MSRPSAIEALAADPAMSALIMDFDGVLSPIVEDPASSAMPDPTAVTLGRLAPRLGLVAVVSGRPAVFLGARVHVPGVRVLGSYGMEQVSDGRLWVDPAVQPWLGKVADATTALEEAFGSMPGIRIERKSVSVAAHWRQAPDQEAAAAQVRRAGARIAAQTGLRLEPGKLVLELRPPIDVDKGSAIAGLLAEARPAAVAYAGDDLGDLPALLVVRDAGGYALVVDHGAETDLRLREAADQSYAGTGAFADWLAALADRIGA